MCKHDPIYKIENEQNGGIGCPLCTRERRDRNAAQIYDSNYYQRVIATRNAPGSGLHSTDEMSEVMQAGQNNPLNMWRCYCGRWNPNESKWCSHEEDERD